MKTTYLGTKVDDPEYLDFGVRAAQQGKSKAALLKSLVQEYLEKAAKAEAKKAAARAGKEAA